MYIRSLLFGLFLTSSAFAQNFFPLALGNQWVYRDRNSSETLTITVGLPLAKGSFVYYRVTGYTPAPIWVRRADDGNLYALNEDLDRDELLAAFRPQDPYRSIVTPCDQLAEPQRERVPFTAGGTMDSPAVEVRYSEGRCADAGLNREHFAENIGLVRRFVNTIAGPRILELEHASIGPMRFTLRPSSAFVLDLETWHLGRRNPQDVVSINGAIRLSFQRLDSVRVPFPTAQRFDMRLVSPSGDVVWQLSDGEFHAQVLEEVTIGGERVWRFRADLARGGAALPDGAYQLEAWLTTSGDRKFATTAPLRIETVPRDE
ncbi:MAG TPA: BsuPI-related putative proteinase inhibitor [Bryobacteraceae bacterium]|nr:BsuPI-related putative proteinase inhibitor [Bryobacteraceae bacterium]